MLYLIQFTNRHDRDEIRVQHREAHHAFLHTVEDKVLAAGTVSEPGSGTVSGGMWIVSADSEAEAQDIFAGDPYWKEGLRAGFHILEWKRLFPTDRASIID